jgi:formamidopyrimidine-DNA glycosylase
MPELPEVETTRRGIEPHVAGRRIAAVVVRESRLRWPVAPEFAPAVAGQRIERVARRAKYLLIELERGTLILHLGMSGSLRVLTRGTPRKAHDHLDLEIEGGAVLRFNDPRRFGSLHFTPGPAAEHPLLARLGPEPLGPDFTAAYLYRTSRRRRVALKQFLMDSHIVVGVGNIYASEALFRAGVRPGRMARTLTHAQAAKLVRAIRDVLSMAIRVGGTTLRDYVGADGNPGYFRQKLFVYERAGEACRRCGTLVRQRRQGQRSTYFCPGCQR